jgi:hypothetical protein
MNSSSLPSTFPPCRPRSRPTNTPVFFAPCGCVMRESHGTAAPRPDAVVARVHCCSQHHGQMASLLSCHTLWPRLCGAGLGGIARVTTKGMLIHKGRLVFVCACSSPQASSFGIRVPFKLARGAVRLDGTSLCGPLLQCLSLHFDFPSRSWVCMPSVFICEVRFGLLTRRITCEGFEGHRTPGAVFPRSASRDVMPLTDMGTGNIIFCHTASCENIEYCQGAVPERGSLVETKYEISSSPSCVCCRIANEHVVLVSTGDILGNRFPSRPHVPFCKSANVRFCFFCFFFED